MKTGLDFTVLLMKPHTEEPLGHVSMETKRSLTAVEFDLNFFCFQKLSLVLTICRHRAQCKRLILHFIFILLILILNIIFMIILIPLIIFVIALIVSFLKTLLFEERPFKYSSLM